MLAEFVPKQSYFHLMPVVLNFKIVINHIQSMVCIYIYIISIICFIYYYISFFVFV